MLWKTVLRVSYWTLCLWWRICTEIICNNIAYKTVIFLLGLAMNILSTISVLTRIMVVKTEKKRRNRQERLVDNRKQNHNFLHFVFTSVCPSQHTIPRHPWYFAFSSNRKKDQFLSTQKSEIEHHYHQQQQQQQQQLTLYVKNCTFFLNSIPPKPSDRLWCQPASHCSDTWSSPRS